jgi:hypothetical protein
MSALVKGQEYGAGLQEALKDFEEKLDALATCAQIHSEKRIGGQILPVVILRWHICLLGYEWAVLLIC